MFVKLGSHGEDVVLVQRALIKLGYAVAHDGIFGSNTKKAVLQFQAANDLTPDGIVGKNTYAALTETNTEPKNNIKWLNLAKKEIGVHEVYNESRVHYYWKAAKLSGLTKFPATQIPWCSGFASAMMELAGVRSPRTDGAKNWLGWGTELKEPCDGCVVVFTRTGGGHVGIVVGEDDNGNLLVLGGNQGNAVNVKSFNRSRVTGYRYPEGYKPNSKLSKGLGTELSNDEA